MKFTAALALAAVASAAIQRPEAPQEGQAVTVKLFNGKIDTKVAPAPSSKFYSNSSYRRMDRPVTNFFFPFSFFLFSSSWR